MKMEGMYLRKSGLIHVESQGQLDHLIKEGEILTGRPGRRFYLGMRSKRPYQIGLNPQGYDVRMMAYGRESCRTDFMPAEALLASVWQGRLFTRPIRG